MIHLLLEPPIATLAIRRPEKKNAFTTAMWAALAEHVAALSAAASAPGNGQGARALQLIGSDGIFCAGADIAETQARVADPAALAANNRIVSAAQLALERLPLPTVAVIDGPCFGGGTGLAAACDFRLASTRASFAVTPAVLGLLYSIEDTRRLVRLVGDARARRLLLRGERLDAATALAWGLVDAVVEPADLPALADRWLQPLAAASRTAIAGLKATLGFVNGSGAFEEADIRERYDAAFEGADFAEGAAAFLQRRAPRFT